MNCSLFTAQQMLSPGLGTVVSSNLGQPILTKRILAKLMIAVHAFAVNFMHAAELPKIPKGNNE